MKLKSALLLLAASGIIAVALISSYHFLFMEEEQRARSGYVERINRHIGSVTAMGGTIRTDSVQNLFTDLRKPTVVNGVTFSLASDIPSVEDWPGAAPIIVNNRIQ